MRAQVVHPSEDTSRVRLWEWALAEILLGPINRLIAGPPIDAEVAGRWLGLSFVDQFAKKPVVVRSDLRSKRRWRIEMMDRLSNSSLSKRFLVGVSEEGISGQDRFRVALTSSGDQHLSFEGEMASDVVLAEHFRRAPLRISAPLGFSVDNRASDKRRIGIVSRSAQAYLTGKIMCIGDVALFVVEERMDEEDSVRLDVRIGTIEIGLGDLMSLRPGSKVVLDGLVLTSSQLMADGCQIATGRLQERDDGWEFEIATIP